MCLFPTKRTARALRPSQKESQTAQRQPHGPDIDSSLQSCNAQNLCPLVHFISLSLSDLFWLPAHAPCLLYYSSPQSCTVRAATLRVSARWSTSSLSLSQTFSGSLRMLRVCSTTFLLRAATLRVSARWSTSSLSLSQTFSGSLRMLRVCSTTVLLRAALLELQRSESATSLQNP